MGSLFLGVLAPVTWVFDRVFGGVYRTYPIVLHWALGHRLVVIVLSLAIFGGAVQMVGLLGSELIPEMSQGEFTVSVELPLGTPLVATEQTIREMEALAHLDPEVALVYSIIGSSGGTGGSSGEERENVGQMSIVLEEGVIREREEAAMDRLRRAFRDIPAVDYKFSRPALFSAKTPIEVEISGYNLNTLQTLAGELMAKMARIPGLTDVKTTAEGGNPEVQIRFNRKRVAQLGTTISAIGGIIRNQVQGEIATEFTQGDRKVDIRVRAAEEHRSTVDDLKRIIVSRPNAPAPRLAPLPQSVKCLGRWLLCDQDGCQGWVSLEPDLQDSLEASHPFGQLSALFIPDAAAWREKAMRPGNGRRGAMGQEGIRIG